MSKPLFRLYQLVRVMRYSMLYSVFGYVSHCKHTPTCGTYALNMIEKEGYIKGSIKGILRAIQCV